jgi:hypothetical protein
MRIYEAVDMIDVIPYGFPAEFGHVFSPLHIITIFRNGTIQEQEEKSSHFEEFLDLKDKISGTATPGIPLGNREIPGAD